MSNFEKITESPTALAEVLAEAVDNINCDNCPAQSICHGCIVDCNQAIKRWLNSEAD
ncbi:MAG TPA: hypothetical protein VN626_03575 [Clostridia bacterium]|nr:hypothetical protein [Clostridia bacterium]